MANDYYYEQPYEEVATTTTTTTVDDDSSESTRRRRLLIIGLIVFGVVLLIVLLLLLTSKPATTPTTNTTIDPTKKVVLQFQGAFISAAAMQPLLDDYQTLNPNVTVEYVNKWPQGAFTDAENIYKSDLNKVLRDNDSVNIPDIFLVNNSWAGDYDGTYTSPSANISLESFKSIFYPAATEDFAKDGKVHGVPLWMDTLAVLYNKDILNSGSIEAPATTWPEFKSQAQALTKIENGEMKVGGFAAGTTKNVSYAFEISNVLLFQNGVEMLNSKNQVSFSTFPETTTTLQFFRDFAGSNTGTWSDSMKNDAAAFLESKAAMIVATSYRYRDILSYNKAYDIKLNIGVSQLPQLSSGQSEPLINFADYWGAMVAGSRGNSVYAWDFLKWLTQPDQLKKLSTNIASESQSFGLLYPRRDMAQLNQDDPDLSVFAESAPFARSWYMVNGTKVREEFLSLLNKSINTGSITESEGNIQTIINNKGKL